MVLRLLMDVHLHLLLLLLLEALPPQLHFAPIIIQMPRKHRSLYLGACVVDIASSRQLEFGARRRVKWHGCLRPSAVIVGGRGRRPYDEQIQANSEVSSSKPYTTDIYLQFMCAH